MAPALSQRDPTQRRVRFRLRVSGQVQGVGFRPAVYRWAVARGLTGSVCNDAHGAVIEVEGPAADVALFEQGLASNLPRLARIEACERDALKPRGAASFVIGPSESASGADATVTADAAVCDACLAEMRDPANRRHGHALINCTECGPRFSIIEAVPYDRPNTTMKPFVMCARCRLEYEAPADRRFHAQPVCCPGCGPRVTLRDRTGRALPGDPREATRGAAEALMAGRIVAIKGVGGFHLAVRAADGAAVRRLRARKHRDAKPFALMVRDLASARAWVRLSDAGASMLCSTAAPIVLAPRKHGAAAAAEVAPGTHRLGVMLAYTPIHHQLFDLLPTLGPLVMTSGNRSDEPLVTGNAEALRRLGGLADLFLIHDRPIARGVEDSVVIDMAEGLPVPIRRARGMVPGTIRVRDLLESKDRPGLCVGGELKNTVAVVRGGVATLGQHLGDLKHPMAFEHFKRSIDDMLRLFAVEPAWVACDRHPAYLSTVYARRWAASRGVPLIAVQHHHAHAAALMAEHDRHDPILALVADGVGHGDNGEVWGGELLLADRRTYRHIARLSPIRLPGGDASARDTRRCALALLYRAYGEAGLTHPITRRLGLDRAELEALCVMIRRGVRCVESSAMGRVFDGVAALLGLCSLNRFEAEAPMALEASAHAWPAGVTPVGAQAGDPRVDDTARPWSLDVSPVVRRLVEGREHGEPVAALAAWFHQAMARGWSALIGRAAESTGVRTVGLTGGVFANEALTLGLQRALGDAGLAVIRHQRVPPNDGGLSLGQAAIAAAHQAKEG